VTRAARELVLLSAAYWLAALFLPALGKNPLNDDWAFGPAATSLLPQAAATPNLLVQALWGRLFLSLFGGGYAALRMSTLALGWLGALAFHRFLLRRRLCPGRETALTAALLFSPLWFCLSPNFMTDVPCAALVVAAAAAAALERRRAGALVAAAAVGVRQTALAVPAAWLLLLAFERRLSARSAIEIAAPSAAVELVCLFWRAGAPAVAHPLLFTPAILLARAATGLLYCGLFALPAAAAFWLDEPRKRLRALSRGEKIRLLLLGGALAAVAALAGAGLPPDARSFFDCNYLTENGLGCWDLQGLHPPMILGSGLFWAALGALCAGSVATLMIPRQNPAARRFSFLCAAASLAAFPAARFFDRYFLPLVPAALCLGAAAVGTSARSRAGLWAATAALGFFAWAGTADSLRASAAAWTLGERAVARGMAPEEVRASMTWCWAHEWPSRFEQERRRAAEPGVDLPMSCLSDPAAVVSMKESLIHPLPVLDSQDYFSPLRMSRVRLNLYERRPAEKAGGKFAKMAP